jgi:hypothetical protein
MNPTIPHPCGSVSSVVKKPSKVVVPLAIGLGWGPEPDYIYQEKLDGVFATRDIHGDIFAGELMRGGKFHLFDCLWHQGMWIGGCALADRLELVNRAVHDYGLWTADCGLNGGELLQRVLDRGGEGIVRKRLDAPWGTPMEACKRLETFYCVVTGINAGQSVRISKLEVGSSEIDWSSSNLPSSIFDLLSSNSAPCGSVPLFGGKCDRVRVGSILKLEGFGLTAAGKIREPRPCKDTPTSWLVKY